MADSGFEIGGTVYEVPTLDTFNMDEAQVLYDYSGLAVEDFLSSHPDASDGEAEKHRADREQKLKNPAVLRALMHIAYQRGNPDEKAATIRSLLGTENLLASLIAFAGSVDDDEVPPALTTVPEQPSPSSTVVDNTSSGGTSTNGSVERDALPASTTATKSDTSSTSAPTLSVA